MPGGLGPRFALEAGFLILLAGVAAYAELSATEIILVMAGGWLIASIFEMVAAQRERLYPGATWEQRVEPDERRAIERPRPERRLSWFRRPVEAAAPPEEEAAAAPEVVEPKAVEAEPVEAEVVEAEVVEPAAAEPAAAQPVAAQRAAAEPHVVQPIERAPEADEETTGEFELPERRRRWFRWGRGAREAAADEKPEPAAEPIEARPSARHVRLIRPPEARDGEERPDAEARP